MAGDEKHARELIAEAEAFTAVSVIGKPTAREIDRAILLIRRLSAALEAALPGDDDWEFGTAHASDPTQGVPEFTRRAAERRRNAWNESTRTRTGLLVRRRPAGRWEPVEEVPRGE